MNIHYNDIKKIAISNRKLSGSSYFEKMNDVVRAGASALILREKDLTSEEYFLLAAEIRKSLDNFCRAEGKENNFPVFLHSGFRHMNTMKKISQLIEFVWNHGFAGIHFTGEDFMYYYKYGQQQEKCAAITEFKNKKRVGVSVHSIEEAGKAEGMGADYLITGHIFETDCKPGVLPRGLDFLQSVCKNVAIPVYAIGGISEKNAALTVQSGAAGICMMSGYFKA